MKNEERKKRKGHDGAVAVHTAINNNVEDRLLLLEDVVEKWDDRMDVWGSMLSILYEAQFEKSATRVHKEEQKQTPISQKVQFGVSVESEESGDENGSVQSSHDNESSNKRTSEEDDENSPGKSAEVPHASGKLKEKSVQETKGKADVVSISIARGKTRSGAWPSEQGWQSLSTSEKMPKVSSIFHYSCPDAWKGASADWII